MMTPGYYPWTDEAFSWKEHYKSPTRKEPGVCETYTEEGISLTNERSAYNNHDYFVTVIAMLEASPTFQHVKDLQLHSTSKYNDADPYVEDLLLTEDSKDALKFCKLVIASGDFQGLAGLGLELMDSFFYSQTPQNQAHIDLRDSVDIDAIIFTKNQDETKTHNDEREVKLVNRANELIQIKQNKAAFFSEKRKCNTVNNGGGDGDCEDSNADLAGKVNGDYLDYEGPYKLLDARLKHALAKEAEHIRRCQVPVPKSADEFDWTFDRGEKNWRSTVIYRHFSCKKSK
jgi:hypothetical protein